MRSAAIEALKIHNLHVRGYPLQQAAQVLLNAANCGEARFASGSTALAARI